MQIELKLRTEENVRIYFERTRDPEIQARIPQRSQTVEQALEAYRGTSGAMASTPSRALMRWSVTASLKSSFGAKALRPGRCGFFWRMLCGNSALQALVHLLLQITPPRSESW